MSNKNYIIADSSIHGKGVFAKRNLYKGDKIGLGINFVFGLWPLITEYLGIWINHCDTKDGKGGSNVGLEWDESIEAYGNEGDGWYVVANRDIKKGEELYLDYSETPWYIEGPLDHYTC